MPVNAVIELGAFLVRHRECIDFQTFPNCIQQFGFLGGRGISICCRRSLIVYNPSAVPLPWQGCFGLRYQALFRRELGRSRSCRQFSSRDIDSQPEHLVRDEVIRRSDGNLC